MWKGYEMLSIKDYRNAEAALNDAVLNRINPEMTQVEREATLKSVRTRTAILERLERDQSFLKGYLDEAVDGRDVSDGEWNLVKRAADRIRLMQELLGDD